MPRFERPGTSYGMNHTKFEADERPRGSRTRRSRVARALAVHDAAVAVVAGVGAERHAETPILVVPSKTAISDASCRPRT